MIGIDIVDVARFEGKLKNARFMARVFTVHEASYLAGKGVQSMAGLFAAKEAVVKAIGCGFSGFFPCDVEILHRQSGAPYVRLHGAARLAYKKKRLSRFCIHVSISHTQTIATAIAQVTPRNYLPYSGL